MKKFFIALILCVVSVWGYTQSFHESYTTTINGETYHTYISGYGNHATINTYKVTTPKYYNKNVENVVKNYSLETKESFDAFMDNQYKQSKILKYSGIAVIGLGCIGCICSLFSDDNFLPLAIGSGITIGLGTGLFMGGKYKHHDYNMGWSEINYKK